MVRSGPHFRCESYRNAISFSAARKDRNSFSLLFDRALESQTLTGTMAPNMSLFSVNAILVLSTDDSSRILAKYYNAPHPPLGTPANSSSYPGANPFPTVKDQKAFEKGLLEKTAKQTNDIILYDNRVVVFKVEGDVMLYVVGGADENEILLYNVILALRDSLNILLK